MALRRPLVFCDTCGVTSRSRNLASAKDTSVTAHCHAATAQLTREYQGDHRRYVLTPATTCAAHHLTTPSISGATRPRATRWRASEARPSRTVRRRRV